MLLFDRLSAMMDGMSNADVAVMQLERTPPPVSSARELLRWVFLPAMVGLMGVGIWLAGSGAAKWQLMAVLLVAIGFSFAAERIAPYETSWNSPSGDAGRDVAHTLVNEALQLVALVSLPVLVNLVGFEGVWPDGWPFWMQVLVSVMALDAGLTLGHWWSHRWLPLWRLHAVHHSVQRFYGFNGLMKHPLHQLFETGVATAEDVDTACRLGFGHAMGPLATTDLTGVDILRDATMNIYAETADEKFFPPESLTRMVAAGDLGRKSGRGFYTYDQ